MVRKQTQTQCPVDKPFMQRLFQRLKRKVITENVSQTLCLFRLVRQKTNRIALFKKLFVECLPKKFHVFMKQRLRNDIKPEGCLRNTRRLMSELYTAKRHHLLGKLHPREQTVLTAHRLHQLLPLHLRQFVHALGQHL